jgi:hypothetical protein
MENSSFSRTLLSPPALRELTALSLIWEAAKACCSSWRHWASSPFPPGGNRSARQRLPLLYILPCGAMMAMCMRGDRGSGNTPTAPNNDLGSGSAAGL